MMMGKDTASSRILKQVASTVCKLMKAIFQKSIDTGTLPCHACVWKEASDTAIYKKGNKQMATNYRPVSLTSVSCKVLEYFVRQEIVDHMKRNYLFTPFQYGFRERRSTTLQLLHTLEDWSKSIDEGATIDTSYLELIKVFDSIGAI